MQLPDCFTHFKESIESYTLPEKFTFPFYYQPNALCVLAANELQEQLSKQKDWQHNFGIDPNNQTDATGKMFGVLVVKTENNIVGYLATFSGRLTNDYHPPQFVPSVFDMFDINSFLNKGLKKVAQISTKIKALEESPDYTTTKDFFNHQKEVGAKDLEKAKAKINASRENRKHIREEGKKELSPILFEELNEKLIQESLRQKFYLKHLTLHWEDKLASIEKKLAFYTDQINHLKEQRKTTSNNLQSELFKQYQFSDQSGNLKNLIEIFEKTEIAQPPAGTGECAAPKLFQYAFQHNLTPIAMAEFWWGKSPKSEIRKHQHYYPACIGKCKPILEHMLNGIEMDENPLIVNLATDQKIEILFEDEYLTVINKPANLLSVPGRVIQDSVFQRMKEKYPLATGPLIVHRLDMQTSGIMLIAKTKEVHKLLQHQFIQRTVKKKYVALLDGIITEDEGTIDLPLRVDLNDRPRQLVCYEYGKSAITNWEVINRSNNQTRVYFFPITGRTHQLRVHAAHQLGLNSPIVGDDLYGTNSTRLHLHAVSINFTHPNTHQKMTIEISPDF